ncbi:hypothetical protein TPHA_0D02520 [Tetrapisispora phaffii CBS 4417]|uniref:Uncharacterized protein n=1 Tax=Tetrapisispora phaffii (strain ATCC 24235 / CBS 4417 / NBRC 1672 / NRRL Y-8282 / UCD 70-5) TaxID=1071381 RepID=G8BSR8_TETPH|nr:hypothetical protein TPHA_0D02520 [Tetrapisispora phaffii CBS 4417]CCE62889.1 hypothetical protein TPHA_0D02520 [Tetrapisispora phaffii CBS 4417]
MTSLLQLLYNYQMSVIESERFYYTHLLEEKELNTKNEALIKNNDNTAVLVDDITGKQQEHSLSKELISLQRQLTKVSIELQTMKLSNEQLKEAQKVTKNTMNQKLNNSLKTIERLKSELSVNNSSHGDEDASSVTPPKIFNTFKNNEIKQKNNIHLLSPVTRKESGHLESNNKIEKLSGIRNIVNSKKHTLFDMDTESEADNSLNSIENVLKINTLKRNEVLANMVLPKDALPESSDINSSQNILSVDIPLIKGNTVEEKQVKNHHETKKRTLTKTRIQKLDSDDSLL